MTPEIDGGEMRCGGDAGLAQDRRRQRPAEPGRMPQHRNLVQGIEGNNRLQHLRADFRLAAPPSAIPPAARPRPSRDHRPADPFRGSLKPGRTSCLSRWLLPIERAPLLGVWVMVCEVERWEANGRSELAIYNSTLYIWKINQKGGTDVQYSRGRKNGRRVGR